MKYNKISISGRICTGKSTLFGFLERELEWKIFSSSAYFRKYAKEKGLSIDKAEEQNNKLTKKIDYMVSDMLKNKTHLIAEGWMTGVMAGNEKDVLKILLTCPDPIRYQRYALREHVSLRQAERD